MRSPSRRRSPSRASFESRADRGPTRPRVAGSSPAGRALDLVREFGKRTTRRRVRRARASERRRRSEGELVAPGPRRGRAPDDFGSLREARDGRAAFRTGCAPCRSVVRRGLRCQRVTQPTRSRRAVRAPRRQRSCRCLEVKERGSAFIAAIPSRRTERMSNNFLQDPGNSERGRLRVSFETPDQDQDLSENFTIRHPPEAHLSNTDRDRGSCVSGSRR